MVPVITGTITQFRYNLADASAGFAMLSQRSPDSPISIGGAFQDRSE
jgi:hypothetical protein